MSNKQYKPGQIAPRSGQYERIGSRGGRSGAEVTVTKGEPMPPTPKRGESYRLADATKHKGGR
ncbi:YjzC family protein [Cerasicoccus fimbriatus]|uniref:YjzC family protein n=1 Tax=Cerasicoccus fimbriatus TaxID=3014554 RepID=UPI0031B82B30